MQRCWRCARRRWRSARRRSRSAECGAGRGSRRRSGWRCSARSAGERCGCRGTGSISAVVVGLLAIAAVAYLWRRLRGRGGGAARRLAGGTDRAAAASLPFVVEGHFGILGTSFNPDMSQHLLAADRLADGQGGQLLHQGYPLGPHAIVVALHKGLGIGLVQGFSGLTVAVAVLAPLTALAAFAELRPLPRTAGALVVGLAYWSPPTSPRAPSRRRCRRCFVLAFALALREVGPRLAGSAPALRPGGPDRRRLRLRLQLPGPDLAGWRSGPLADRLCRGWHGLGVLARSP